MKPECKDKCWRGNEKDCVDLTGERGPEDCPFFNPKIKAGDPVTAPSHYTGGIECIDYLRDKLTEEEFTGFCIGNVLKYASRWRKKDGVQDLKKAEVYLKWAIENEEKQ